MAETVPNCCGFDPEHQRKLRAQLEDGSLIAVFHKPTGRILYVSPEERAALHQDDYLPLLRPAAA